MTTIRGELGGDYAHGSPDTSVSFPVKIGGLGNAALPTAVDEGDRVNASFDLLGRQRTLSLGDIAHDSPDTGTSSPIKIGGWASATFPAAVGEGDRVNASFDLQGSLRTISLGDIAHDGPDTSTSFPIKLGGFATTSLPTAVLTGDRVNASFDLQGVLRTRSLGDIAHDGADTSTSLPIKLGGFATAALPTGVGEGDRVNASFDLLGALRTRSLGDIAHDAPDTSTSNPIKLGGLATTSLPTAVLTGDRVNASFDLQGVLRTRSLGDIAHDSPDTSTSLPQKFGGWATADHPTAVGEGDRVNASFNLQGAQRTLALGDIAHDSPDTSTSNPVKISGIAKSQDGTPSYSVAEDDRVNAVFDLQGNQFVNIGHPYFFQTSTIYTAPQTNGELATTPGASLSYYITDIAIGADAVLLGATSGTFSIVENTAAPVTRFRGYIAGGEMFSHSFRIPIKLSANTNIGLNTSLTNTSFNISGYVGP